MEVEDFEHLPVKMLQVQCLQNVFGTRIHNTGGEMIPGFLLDGNSLAKKQFKILKATENYIKCTSLYRL